MKTRKKKQKHNRTPKARNHTQTLETTANLPREASSLLTESPPNPNDGKTAQTVSQPSPIQRNPENQAPETSSNPAQQAAKTPPTEPETRTWANVAANSGEKPASSPQNPAQPTQKREALPIAANSHKNSYLDLVNKAKDWGITLPITPNNILQSIEAALNRQRIITPNLNEDQTTQEILNVIAGLVALGERNIGGNRSLDALRANQGGIAVIFTNMNNDKRSPLLYPVRSIPGKKGEGFHTEERMIQEFWSQIPAITGIPTHSSQQQKEAALKNFRIQLAMFSERNTCGSDNHNCQKQVSNFFKKIQTHQNNMASFIYTQEFKKTSKISNQQKQFGKRKTEAAPQDNQADVDGFDRDIAQKDINAALQKLDEQPAQKLRNNARQYGLETHDVLKDGNCLFSAIYAQLPNDLQQYYGNATRLRMDIVEYMRASIDQYQGFMGGQNPNQYLEDMADPRTWEGHLEIVAASRLLNCTIAIIRSDNENPNIIRQSQSKQTLYLGFEDPGHYQYLFPDQINIHNPRKNLDQIIAEHELDDGKLEPEQRQPQTTAEPAAPSSNTNTEQSPASTEPAAPSSNTNTEQSPASAEPAAASSSTNTNQTAAFRHWVNRPSIVNQPPTQQQAEQSTRLSTNANSFFNARAKTSGSSQVTSTPKEANTPSNYGPG